MDKDEIKKNIHVSLKKNPYLHKIKKVSLFGSYLHGTADEESDVDLLVELDRGVGFFTLARIRRDIADRSNKNIDLVTADALSKYFRERVINEAELIYERERTR